MVQANQSLIEDAYDAFAKKDAPRLLSLFTEDVTFHVPGRGAVSGTYRGKEQVAGLFGRLDELSEGTFGIELQQVLTGDEFAAALVLTLAQQGGRSYEGRDVHAWRLVDGRLGELWVHPGDQYEADAFFSVEEGLSIDQDNSVSPGSADERDEGAGKESGLKGVAHGVAEKAKDVAAKAADVAEEATEKVKEVVGGDGTEDVPRAQQVAAKAMGHKDAPEREGPSAEDASGRRRKR